MWNEKPCEDLPRIFICFKSVQDFEIGPNQPPRNKKFSCIWATKYGLISSVYLCKNKIGVNKILIDCTHSNDEITLN